MIRPLKFILLLLVFPLLLNGQNLFEVKYHFNSILENGNRANPYFVGNNPAYLHLDDRDQLLWIQGAYSNEYGSYKRFIDPNGKGMYQINFSGKKILDDSQIFKGNFAVQRIERRNWDWISSRNYDNGSPFLIGDSTTGSTRYNGIIARAEYAALIMRHIRLGFKFDYSVDEGLKEVAPRPTTEHRDIDATFGIGYDFTSQFSIGIKGKIFDLNETIFYREDEGAITQETILLKFKGYDHPFVVKKKVETRFSYHNGYEGGLNLYYNDGGNFEFAGYLDGGFEQLVVKDDANNPQTEGFWKSDKILGGLQLKYGFSDNLKLGLKYDFVQLDSWSKHSDYNILLSENSSFEHKMNIGLEYELNGIFDIGSEAGIEVSEIDYNDYYSSVYWGNKSVLYSLSFGAKAEWSEDFSTTLAGEYSKKNISEKNEDFKNNSKYFNDFRIKDILFYQTGTDGWRFYFRTRLYPGFLGHFYFYLVYATRSPSEYFDSAVRSYINAVIELRMSLY